MNRILLILLIMLGVQAAKAQQNIIVSTYNIRLDVPSDNPNHWENRKAFLASVVLFNQVEILGVQEALHHQMKDLDSLLPQFAWTGVARDDGAQKGEYSAIFYRKDLYDYKKGGTFWLSETPENPSRGWDAALPRVCTWAVLEQKSSGRKVFVMNTHFDHVGQQARAESASLILKKAEELNTDHLPLIVMGDMNATATQKPIQLFSNKLLNTENLADIKMLASGTFNAFQWDTSPQNTIDYIFINNRWKVIRYGVITQSDVQRYPSDHFPVIVELGFAD
ncbi:endonuclease/exonuclease/phosphatase family protein [Cytophagales bacterium LB-30]|uniref:Endonuclease/exonuclease/phosphatase family protein n=1 Tax=Shiella aurantiaca TaxID=3058365 RepID=A0ABT8F3F5_9BACT|nr:endonuclease/exonuclease/phosphatase family protein [Shiella aurantiaca]MDN4164997.1 endonuclease/exonuclease/phosphatase family protein [Shiella aurantiaca]